MIVSVASNDPSTAGYAQARTSEAVAIAALARQSGAGRIIAFENGGVSAINDRILTISGTGLASARYGASLLQAAAGALEAIVELLDRMKELAETISPATAPTSDAGGATSTIDRAILDAEFAALRSEADRLAQAAEFDGTKILLGDGAGNALQLTFRVGSGTAAADGLSVAIGPARVADLSAGLATGNLASAAAAAAAVSDVKAAIGALDAIRGAVRGAGQRISAAVGNALGMTAALDETRARRGAVDVAVDTARVLGEKIIDQGDLALSDVSLQLFRHMLSSGGNDAGRPDDGTPRSTSDGTGTTGATAGTRVPAGEPEPTK